jgi:alpha-galactosidase
MAQSITSDLGRVRLPGLQPDRVYRVSRTATPGFESRTAPWWVDGGHVEMNGAALAAVGVQVPAQWPESAILLDVKAVDS